MYANRLLSLLVILVAASLGGCGFSTPEGGHPSDPGGAAPGSGGRSDSPATPFILGHDKAETPPRAATAEGPSGPQQNTPPPSMQPAADGPTATGLSLSTTMNLPIELSLEAVEPSGRPLTFQVTAPLHGHLVQGARPNVFTYVPMIDFSGQDAFTFKANDGQRDSNEATITIAVFNNTSCAKLLESGGSHGDDVYAIDPDASGPRPAFPAYCDMTTDHGGWLLVGRSVPPPVQFGPGPRPMGGMMGPPADEPAHFGWAVSLGSLTDDTMPYALGAARAGIDFTQILVASYAVGKQVSSAYRLDIPVPHFVTACADHLCQVTPTPIVNACPAIPALLMFAGLTMSDQSFVFAGTDMPDGMGGLRADGFQLALVDCGGLNLGALGGQQGMIFVR